jgi:hypothetical protein
MKRKRTSDALEIIEGRVRSRPRSRRMVERANLNAQVAEMIYGAHTDASLTQGASWPISSARRSS